MAISSVMPQDTRLRRGCTRTCRAGCVARRCCRGGSDAGADPPAGLVTQRVRMIGRTTAVATPEFRSTPACIRPFDPCAARSSGPRRQHPRPFSCAIRGTRATRHSTCCMGVDKSLRQSPPPLAARAGDAPCPVMHHARNREIRLPGTVRQSTRQSVRQEKRQPHWAAHRQRLRLPAGLETRLAYVLRTVHTQEQIPCTLAERPHSLTPPRRPLPSAPRAALDSAIVIVADGPQTIGTTCLSRGRDRPFPCAHRSTKCITGRRVGWRAAG